MIMLTISYLLIKISSEKHITHTSPVLKTEPHLLNMSMFLPCQKHDPFMNLKTSLKPQETL